MKPARFDYIRPATLDEALRLLADHGPDASLLAGGQSMMPMLNLRMARPSLLIDINAIPDLERIELRPDHLIVGGRARHNNVLRSPIVRAEAPLLTQALAHVAHEAIRNRGTLGGSLALADPSAELPACAVCLEADIVAQSVRGERRIPAGEFFQDLYTTTLEPDEIIREVVFPRQGGTGGGWCFAFDEVARRSGDFAIACLALGVQMEGGAIGDVRIVFAGVEPSPRRMAGAEAALRGAVPNDRDAQARAAAALSAELDPIGGGEYPPDYRIHVAGSLLARLLDRIAGGQNGRV